MSKSGVCWSLSLYKLSVALFDFRQTELCTIASSSTHVVDFSIVLVLRQTLMNWISSLIPSWLHLVCRARQKKNCYFFEGVVSNWCSTVVLFNMRLSCSSSPLGIWIIYIHSLPPPPPPLTAAPGVLPQCLRQMLLVCLRSLTLSFVLFSFLRECVRGYYTFVCLLFLIIFLTLSLPSRALKCPFLPFPPFPCITTNVVAFPYLWWSHKDQSPLSERFPPPGRTQRARGRHIRPPPGTRLSSPAAFPGRRKETFPPPSLLRHAR